MGGNRTPVLLFGSGSPSPGCFGQGLHLPQPLFCVAAYSTFCGLYDNFLFVCFIILAMPFIILTMPFIFAWGVFPVLRGWGLGSGSFKYQVGVFKYTVEYSFV